MKKYRYIIAIITLLLLVYSFPTYAQGDIEGAEIETENTVYNPLDELPKDCQPQEAVDIVLTQDWIITGNQGLVTISQGFSDYTPADIEAMLGYPGYTQPIIINTNGHRIIIKEGGTLILQEFDANSAPFSIEGEHSESLFLVERGGTLSLNQVLVQNHVGKAIKVEAGAKYSWSGSDEKYEKPSVEASQGVIALEPASGVRLQPLKVYDDVVWSDELPAEYMPELGVICSVDGVIEPLSRKLKVLWNTENSKQALEQRQDCQLEGSLVDENLNPIESYFVPMLPVLFLERKPVQILSSNLTQNDSGTYVVEIQFEIPTDYESICLEVSEDSGENWVPIASIGDGIMLRGGMAYAEVPDKQIRYYRMVVEGGPNAGYSQTIQLPEAETSKPDTEEDKGNGEDNSNNRDEVDGNRGGGTSVNPPDRELPPQSQEEGSEFSSLPETKIEDAEMIEKAEITEQEQKPALESEKADLTKREQKSVSESEKEANKITSIEETDSIDATIENSKDLQMQHKEENGTGIEQEVKGEQVLREKTPLSKGKQAAVAVLGVSSCGIVTGMVCNSSMRKGVWRLILKILGK